MSAKARLSTDQCRAMTDREVASVLSAICGGFTSNGTDVATVRRAARWLADKDEVWATFAALQQNIGEARMFLNKVIDAHGIGGAP